MLARFLDGVQAIESPEGSRPTPGLDAGTLEKPA